MEEPQQTAAGLGPRIMEAFEAPHVRIDAICLTAESLNMALAEPLQLIRSGQITPETVKVRVLVPSRDLELAFPRPAERSPVTRGWCTNTGCRCATATARYCGHSLRALRSTRGIDVEVTLKALPFTPPVKLYLLNGSEALFAYYTVKKREEQIDDTPIEIYDALGSDSMLFPFERGGGARDEAFVTQSQAWFDGLWGTIATGDHPRELTGHRCRRNSTRRIAAPQVPVAEVPTGPPQTEPGLCHAWPHRPNQSSRPRH